MPVHLKKAHRIHIGLYPKTEKLFKYLEKKTGVTYQEIKAGTHTAGMAALEDFYSVVDVETGMRMDFCRGVLKGEVAYGLDIHEKLQSKIEKKMGDIPSPGFIVDPSGIKLPTNEFVSILPYQLLEKFFLSMSSVGFSDWVIKKFTKDIEADLKKYGTTYLNRVPDDQLPTKGELMERRLPEDNRPNDFLKRPRLDEHHKSVLTHCENLGIEFEQTTTKCHVFSHEFMTVRISTEGFRQPLLL